MKLKILKTPADHKQAVARIAVLMDKEPPPGSPESDELAVLAHLAEHYEKQHHDIGMPDAISAISFRMEQQGLVPKDLVPFLGSPSRVSEILGGKRPLTVQMIRNLHQGLGIPLEVLVMSIAATRPRASKTAKRSRGRMWSISTMGKPAKSVVRMKQRPLKLHAIG